MYPPFHRLPRSAGFRACSYQNDDREVVFHAKGECSHVHHFQLLTDAFIVCDLIVAFGFRVFFRVGGINAVHVSLSGSRQP